MFCMLRHWTDFFRKHSVDLETVSVLMGLRSSECGKVDAIRVGDSLGFFIGMLSADGVSVKSPVNVKRGYFLYIRN